MSQVRAAAYRAPFLWRAAAPLLCVAHCVSAPALVLLVPALAESALVEGILLLLAGMAGVGSAWTGVRRHGEGRVWLPIVAGLLVWGVDVAGVVPVPHGALAVAGGLALAAGLFWDARLRHGSGCERCGHAH